MQDLMFINQMPYTFENCSGTDIKVGEGKFISIYPFQ